MIKIIATIERGPEGSYDAGFYDDRVNFSIRGTGRTIPDTVADFYQMHEAMKQLYAELGEDFPEVEYEFKYDTASFLQQYAYAFTLAGLERITGVNQRQLSHYINGVRKPSEKTTRKIEERLHQFGAEIAAVKFI